MVALSGAWQPKLGELADFLAMDSTTLTAAVKTLERRGLLQLSLDETDARVRRPRLTTAGREVVAQAVPLWRDEHRLVQEALPGQDALALAMVLAQLR